MKRQRYLEKNQALNNMEENWGDVYLKIVNKV